MNLNKYVQYSEYKQYTSGKPSELFSMTIPFEANTPRAINYEFLDQNYKDWKQSKSFQPIGREHYPFYEHPRSFLPNDAFASIVLRIFFYSIGAVEAKNALFMFSVITGRWTFRLNRVFMDFQTKYRVERKTLLSLKEKDNCKKTSNCFCWV